MIEGLWCLGLDLLPMWYLIDNDRRLTNEVGELQYQLAETMHSLAADLAARPRRQECGWRHPVTGIEHGREGVRVLTDGGVLAADAALVAAPPTMASRIGYAPALPPALANALGAWRSGTVIKVAGALRPRLLARQRLERHGDVARAAGAVRLQFRARMTAHGAACLLHRRAAGGRVGPARRGSAAGGGDREAGCRTWTRGRRDTETLRSATGAATAGAAAPTATSSSTSSAQGCRGGASAPARRRSSSPRRNSSPSFPGYVEGALVAGKEAAARVIAAL